uniref:DNA-Directed RNA polymerase II Subunit D n=1 Tax=Florenciella sp. virus SA2 TaxID=3240092 RepID=A0AB39JFC1_9VIRU
MAAEIYNINEQNDILTFEIRNANVSVINSIRRVVLSNIETLVFKGFPHNENNINIIKNNTKFNNEYLKHRISCIPIMNDDSGTFDNFRENYKIVVNVENNTSEIVYVTTKDIVIVNKTTNNEINKEEINRLFPPNKIIQDSDEYILICVLYPNHNSNNSPDSIHFEANFDIGTAKENSCWNVVSNCMYENVKDQAQINKIADNMQNISKKKDFQLLDAEKVYLPNEFKFTVETLGIFSNRQIIDKACNYIISKLNLILQFIKTNNSTEVLSQNELNRNITNGSMSKEELNFYENVYCMLYKEDNFYVFELKEDDYTIGKIIEKYLYEFNENGNIEFVGFKKDHPSTFNVKIYIKYKTKVSSSYVFIHLMNTANYLINMYQLIQSEFKN